MIKKYALIMNALLLIVSMVQIRAMDTGARKATAVNQNGAEPAQMEKSLCSICQDDIDAESALIKIKCNHVFHYECLDDHVQKGVVQTIGGKRISCCPECNAPITEITRDADRDATMQELERLEREAADEAEARRLAGADGQPVDEDEQLLNIAAQITEAQSAQEEADLRETVRESLLIAQAEEQERAQGAQNTQVRESREALQQREPHASQLNNGKPHNPEPAKSRTEPNPKPNPHNNNSGKKPTKGSWWTSPTGIVTGLVLVVGGSAWLYNKYVRKPNKTN